MTRLSSDNAGNTTLPPPTPAKPSNTTQHVKIPRLEYLRDLKKQNKTKTLFPYEHNKREEPVNAVFIVKKNKPKNLKCTIPLFYITSGVLVLAFQRITFQRITDVLFRVTFLFFSVLENHSSVFFLLQSDKHTYNKKMSYTFINNWYRYCGIGRYDAFRTTCYVEIRDTLRFLAAPQGCAGMLTPPPLPSPLSPLSSFFTSSTPLKTVGLDFHSRSENSNHFSPSTFRLPGLITEDQTPVKGLHGCFKRFTSAQTGPRIVHPLPSPLHCVCFGFFFFF